jgi:hypothetical protein
VSWQHAAVLGAVMGAMTMMSEATPASDLSALLEASASTSRGQRLEALHQLARQPRPIKDARIAAGLVTLDPSDTEAALRLELIARLRDPAARPVVLSWTSAALAARPSSAEPNSWRRALIAAAQVIAEAPDPSADVTLLSLAALDDLAIARAALAALAGRPAFQAPQHVSRSWSCSASRSMGSRSLMCSRSSAAPARRRRCSRCWSRWSAGRS